MYLNDLFVYKESRYSFKENKYSRSTPGENNISWFTFF